MEIFSKIKLVIKRKAIKNHISNSNLEMNLSIDKNRTKKDKTKLGKLVHKKQITKADLKVI